MSLLLFWLAAAVQTAAPMPAEALHPAGDLIFVPPVADDLAMAGPAATNCIATHRVRATRIVRGKGIIYELSGSKRYINRLRMGADRLDRSDILLIRTPGGLLCAGDSVQLIDAMTGLTARSVSLGAFEPYPPDQRAAR